MAVLRPGGSQRTAEAGAPAKPAAKTGAKPGARAGALTKARAGALTKVKAGAGRVAGTAAKKPPKPAPKAAPKPPASPAAKGTAKAGPRRSGPGGLLMRALAVSFALLCLATCVAVVLELTLRPSPASVGIAHTNLRPGATIRLYLDQPSVREAVLQIGGNILVGVPFGLLLPSVWPRARGLLRVIAITALVILLVELAQRLFVEGRAFDVDDIILAAFGAALGYLPVGRLLARWAHPRHRHRWQRVRDSLLRRSPVG